MRRQMLLAVLMVGICSRADALVLCAPKKGTGPVTVQTACGKNEVQLNPATLGLQGPPGPMGPQGVPGQTGPQGPTGPGAVVKDANGMFIGVLSHIDLTAITSWGVLRDVGGTTVLIPVLYSPPSFYRSPVTLLYESTDCSGPGLLPADSN